MSGMIAVKEYTSAAEMRAGYGAARARLMDGPRRNIKIVEPVIPEPDTFVPPHDAHVTAWLLWSYNKRIKSLEMSLRNCEKTIQRMVGDEESVNYVRVSADDVCKAVLAETEAAGLGTYTMTQIRSGRRDRALIKVRHLCVAAVVRECQHLSYPQIGRFFKRDHSSVLHAATKMGVRR